eukprot:GHVN01026201.1.p1 GENE.GHVN01026201.1~~GHVN01026201.1.p1  ORF type:complete len:375 (+),score=105.87 GHVN01026201.1:131-1255(+)
MKRQKPDESSSTTTYNKRVTSLKPLVAPRVLIDEIPITSKVMEVVQRGRREVEECLSGNDDRLIVVVGPCSIHDPKAAVEYANHLTQLAQRFTSDLVVIMRVYFEKPRTTVGWKGLINDPTMNGEFKIDQGLKIARQLLFDINGVGISTGTEFLDSISPQYTSDLIAWGAIGARTSESQIHRELASGMSCPIGFKNGTSGKVKVALDGIRCASSPHSFLGVTEEGQAAIVSTCGNPHTHLILRGGTEGPNYDAKSVSEVKVELKTAKISTGIMIDVSHDNSRKDHTKQPTVCESVSSQIRAGETAIVGVMIESNLVGGNQAFEVGVSEVSELKYGVSVTDACVDLIQTEAMLSSLAEAVRERRKVRGGDKSASA